MPPPLPPVHTHLAIEAELPAGHVRFVRERLRLPMGLEASFGWLRHPPSVLVVPRRADGRWLVLRRYRPAVDRWVLEFPSGVLLQGESSADGGARLLRQLTGHGGRRWQALGRLRPNPGYSDEHMTLGLIEVEPAGGVQGDPADVAGTADGIQDELQVCTLHELESALERLEEPLDGRSVSAWLLAKLRGEWG
ncbi:MAG: NUDIX hydrolase [Cyanobacteriota bacterium]|jgi:ADP-ribose pyrophosphatase